MKLLRPATPNDKNAFRDLWDISFNDDKQFSDWMFSARFIPEFSACIEEPDGTISSEVQSIPLFLNVRGHIIPAAMMVGACTHPDYKRRGYMKQLYTYFMNMVNKKGIILCPHTPAVLKTYFYVGHYPVSDSAFIDIEKAEETLASGGIDFDLNGDISPLLSCYNVSTENYSGIVKRSFADFRLKADDYIAGGASCIAVYENNEVSGYAIYFDEEDGVMGEEIIAKSDEIYELICKLLINIGKDRHARIKLPPFVSVNITQGSYSSAPRNVCGIANAQALLRIVGMPIDIRIKIVDDVVSENNGVFFPNGERTTLEPHIELKIHRFAQFIFGYKSLSELSVEEGVQIYDKAAADVLDRLFPKQLCHIVDEY